MFNRKKIEHLKWEIESLNRNSNSYQDQIWGLRADLEKLTRYLGVKFVNVNERRVQEVTPKPEEV